MPLFRDEPLGSPASPPDQQAGRRWTLGALLILAAIGAMVAGTILHRRSLNDRLLKAASESNTAAVKALLNAGADASFHWEGAIPATPLAGAAWSGDAESVALLLERGAKVDQRDKFHQTPLMFAVQLGHLQAARLLVKAGANRDAKDSTGMGMAERLNQFWGPEDEEMAVLLRLPPGSKPRRTNAEVPPLRRQPVSPK